MSGRLFGNRATKKPAAAVMSASSSSTSSSSSSSAPTELDTKESKMPNQEPPASLSHVKADEMKKTLSSGSSSSASASALPDVASLQRITASCFRKLGDLDLSEASAQDFKQLMKDAGVVDGGAKLVHIANDAAWTNVDGEAQRVHGLPLMFLWRAQLTEEERKDLQSLPTKPSMCNDLFPKVLLMELGKLPVDMDIRKGFFGPSPASSTSSSSSASKPIDLAAKVKSLAAEKAFPSSVSSKKEEKKKAAADDEADRLNSDDEEEEATENLSSRLKSDQKRKIRAESERLLQRSSKGGSSKSRGQGGASGMTKEEKACAEQEKTREKAVQLITQADLRTRLTNFAERATELGKSRDMGALLVKADNEGMSIAKAIMSGSANSPEERIWNVLCKKSISPEYRAAFCLKLVTTFRKAAPPTSSAAKAKPKPKPAAEDMESDGLEDDLLTAKGKKKADEEEKEVKTTKKKAKAPRTEEDESEEIESQPKTKKKKIVEEEAEEEEAHDDLLE